MTVPISGTIQNADSALDDDDQLAFAGDAQLMRFGPDGDTAYLPVEFVHMTLPPPAR